MAGESGMQGSGAGNGLRRWEFQLAPWHEVVERREVRRSRE